MVPQTLEELLKVGSEELEIEAFTIREMATEALIKDVRSIENGAVVWLLTKDEEKEFE